MERRARIETHPLPPMGVSRDIHAAAAHPAPRKAGQQVLRFDPVRRLSPELPARGAQVRRTRVTERLMRCGPFCFRHDTKRRRGNCDLLVLVSHLALFYAPRVSLLGFVPDDLAAVQLSVQHLPDRGRAPTMRPSLLRTWTQRAGFVQRLGDHPEALTLG